MFIYLAFFKYLHWRARSNPFKRQSHRMVKHTQTTLQEIANEFFECVFNFVGLALEGLNNFWPIFPFRTSLNALKMGTFAYKALNI